MKLSDERYEEIKNIVADIFVKLNISHTPINGFEIARKLNIHVIPYSSCKSPKKLIEINEDGICIEDKTGVLYIFYNDNKSIERINWTILHEIGHIVLGHSEHCSLAEAEADFFAKFAIAPPVIIAHYNPSTIKEMQTIFCISREAAFNSLIYYHKWLKIPNLKPYDIKLLVLFGFKTHKK
jgi:Zn-dependent peptidase ImmA (M78 family)